MGARADAEFNTTGSRWLQPVSERLGFPLDQVGASAVNQTLRQALWNRLHAVSGNAGTLVGRDTRWSPAADAHIPQFTVVWAPSWRSEAFCVSFSTELLHKMGKFLNWDS